MDMTVPGPVEASPSHKPAFVLKKLSQKHKQVAALLAQGVDRATIAQIVNIRPEYVTMLSTQPLFLEYIKEMNKFTDARLEAMFGMAVDTVAQVMTSGNANEKLNAAKMALRAVGKEGSLKVDSNVKHSGSLLHVLQAMPPAGPVAQSALKIEKVIGESASAPAP